MPVRLFVGNLPYGATEADLRDLFSDVGEPSRISIPVDRETGRPRGFAFVEYSDPAHGEAAIDRFNGQLFQGRTIAVNEARPKGERPPMGSGPPPSSLRPPMMPRAPFAGGGGPPSGPRGPRPPDRGQQPPRRREVRGPGKKRTEGGPRGPIRERQTGRVYGISDVDDDLPVEDEMSGVDDFATSAPDAKEDEEDET